jgi:hypothetical protein
MFKNFIVLIFLCSLFACNQTEKQATDLPVAKNDTFDFYSEEYDIPISEGFSVDTIKEFDKKTDYSKILILPKLIGIGFSQINKILALEIIRKATFSYKYKSKTEPVDTANELSEVTEENNLIKMKS